MSDSHFLLAAEVALAPFLAREFAREAVKREAHEIDEASCRGVRMSGLAEPLYYRARSAEEIEADAKVAAARALAFAKSERGRFKACIDELEATGYLREANDLRGYYARSISTLNGADADPCAIGSCILILNKIETEVARAGVAALAGLLVQKAA